MEPLTPDEEKIYIEKMRLGDKKAKDILIERNLRLVAHVVKKYYDENRENQDLISIGIVGLIKAVNTYNPDKGNRLVTYAAKCIENELLMMLRAEKKRSKDVSLNEPIGTDKEGNRNNCLEVRIGWQEANDSEKGWGKTWHIKKLCKQNRKKSFRKIKKSS